MAVSDSALPRGTLDLLLLRALSREPLHGYGLVSHVQSTSNDLLRLEEGSVYPALHRLEQAGYLKAEWASSENNRRAKYYRLTAAGRRRLLEEQGKWEQMSEGVTRVLRFA